MYKVFFFVSINCPAGYANSTQNFDGLDSYLDGHAPLLDGPNTDIDVSWVENAQLNFHKVPNVNIADDGFPSPEVFFQWLDAVPLTLKLNRDVNTDEEILFFYNIHDPNEIPAISMVTAEGSREEEKKETAPATEEVLDDKKCAECGGFVDGKHRCDICKRQLHGCCGIGIGDECSTQIRRCKTHVSDDIVHHVEPAVAKGPRAMLFQGFAKSKQSS